MKKVKPQKCDGLGPFETKKIRTALRLVWHRCHARKLTVDRCTDDDGFYRCENCFEVTPKIFIDHKKNVGDLDSGFLARLFCPSKGLQGLCKECHRVKTNAERRRRKKK